MTTAPDMWPVPSLVRRLSVAPGVAVIRILLCFAALLWVACSDPGGMLAAADLAVDHVMMQDPLITYAPSISKFSPELEKLWLAALQRPDSEIRRLTAGTISLACGRGMQGLESTIGPLTDVLDKDDDPVVRRAAAQALVTVNARSAAADLAKAAEIGDVLMCAIVEPALASWDYKPYRDRWLARLADDRTPRLLRLLAVESLGEVREEKAVEPLQAIVRQTSAERPFRLAVARALGNIREAGLVDLATELAAVRGTEAAFSRLLATQLLSRQSDARNIELCKRLAADEDPVVSAPALRRLSETDMAAARVQARSSLASGDAGVRAVAVSIIATQEDTDAVERLHPRLDDRNPTIRRRVATLFAQWGKRDALKPLVLEKTMVVLSKDSWRGCEQASLVLGALDHKPAAGRLVELLRQPRGEAAIAAAWALRKLDVAETLPKSLEYASVAYPEMKKNLAPQHTSKELSQLFQWYGQHRYREAEPLMAQLVPKAMMGIEARQAACWALGYLYENQPESKYVKQFGERLADIGSTPPELNPVRYMCAIGLGRMKAKSKVDQLRQFAQLDNPHSAVGSACLWAVEQITGEKRPQLAPLINYEVNWFLEPLTQ
jgi:HEAT repeat protein